MFWKQKLSRQSRKKNRKQQSQVTYSCHSYHFNSCLCDRCRLYQWSYTCWNKNRQYIKLETVFSTFKEVLADKLNMKQEKSPPSCVIPARANQTYWLSQQETMLVCPSKKLALGKHNIHWKTRCGIVHYRMFVTKHMKNENFGICPHFFLHASKTEREEHTFAQHML